MQGDDAGDLAGRLGCVIQNLSLDRAKLTDCSTLNLHQSLVERYLERLPGALKEEQLADGTTVARCLYTPHSLRATTATLLLNASADIVKVKDLLGHRHITTTQIYDKRRRSTSESASYLLAI